MVRTFVIEAVRRVLRRLPSSVATALAGLVAATAGSTAMAGDLEVLPPEPVSSTIIRMPLDHAVALRGSGDIGKVVVSQPETLEVSSSGDRGLYVIGRQRAGANLLVYDREGRLSQTVDVRVGYDAEALRSSLAASLPDEEINVSELSTGLLLGGVASSAGAADAALRLAEQIAPGAVTSHVVVRGVQVRLDVRIFEAGSRRIRDIGSALALRDGAHVNLRAGSGLIGAEPPELTTRLRLTPGRYSLDAALDALETRGEIEMLAQPTLVSASGARAHFRAGGEVPYPVPGGSTGELKLEFKPYGAAVTVEPDVQANGLIRLRLDAERSELNPGVGLRVGTFTVPGLLTRRATTTLELRDGESHLIAGLFEESSTDAVRGVPLASRAPVIGPLLRAIRRTEDRRELAILVTARLVQSDSAALPPHSTGPPAPAPDRSRASFARKYALPVVTEVTEALAPPVRWAKRQIIRALTTLRLRA